MAVLSDSQKALRDAARQWAKTRSPVSALRKLRDDGVALGFDANAWKEIAQLGFAGLCVPSSHGGSGAGCQSMGLVLEELGRTLTASPLIASGLAAASALVLGGTDAQKSKWLPKLAAGAVIGTLAIDEEPRHAPERVALTATRTRNGYALNGTKRFVLEGMAAQLFVVSARTAGAPRDHDGITLFLVPADAPGLARERLILADSRGAARVRLDNVQVAGGAVLGKVDHGHELLEKILDRARAGLCAEMLGAASQAFETTLDYLKVREQFGRKIGAFQALQHRAAKMFTDLELARSAVEAALQAIDADSPEIPQLVSAAKAKMGDTFHLISNEMIQLHGGIGMTDAHDAGFYIRRARACEATFGSQAYHRNRYATLQGF